MTRADLRAAFDQKVRAGLFKHVARRAPAHLREDLLQDAICQTWEAFVRYAMAGKTLTDKNLVQLCYWKLIARRGRSFVRLTARPRCDVLHWRNFARIPLVFLDETPSKGGDPRPCGPSDAAIATAPAQETRLACLALNAWLDGLESRDKKILRLREAGQGQRAIAQKLGIAPWAVKERLKRMEREARVVLSGAA